MKDQRKQWLILEGDCGGQIYLTVPVELLGRDGGRVPTRAINLLLSELDRFAWGCNDGEGTSAYIIKMHPYIAKRDGVCGGMGGGELTDDLWLHEEFSCCPGWQALVRFRLGL